MQSVQFALNNLTAWISQSKVNNTTSPPTAETVLSITLGSVLKETSEIWQGHTDCRDANESSLPVCSKLGFQKMT